MTVLVLDGNENQAVAATRSLARAGHRVIVGASTRWSKAGWSRACSATFRYPAPDEDVHGFIRHVERATDRCGGAVVLPMTEQTLLPLSQERQRLLDAGAVLILPEHARVLDACSKTRTTQLASALGLDVPQTWTLGRDLDEVRALAGRLPYPVVLKPAMSHEPADRRMRATGPPAYARRPAELVEAWRRMAQRCGSMVVQPFIAGGGAGYFALVRHGDVVAEFAHRRIRDVRPTGSGSAVRESVAVDERLRVPSRRMLGALQWHGVAMVEFRIAPDGTPVFLEVNGRFWNSLPLAIAAGVDFPRLLVALGTTGDIDPPPAYRVGVRCRWWLGDVRHLLHVWRGAPRGYPGTFPGRWSTLAAFLTPTRGMVHDNFTWWDPLPELGDWLHFVGRRLPALAARRAGARRTIVRGRGDAEGRPAHP